MHEDSSPSPVILRSAGLSRAGFSHGFTTRIGGVTPPPHDSLDFAVLREPAQLRENQARLARAVGFEADLFHQSKQVHGAKLLVADGDPKRLLDFEADALVAEPGTKHAVAIRVADCVPILLADPDSGRVAAVHAGWRGVEAGVIKTAVEHLVSVKGARASRLIAAVGPCIGPCCFEVGVDVADRIAKAAGTTDVIDRHVAPAKGSNEEPKAFIDLRRAVRAQLRALDVDDDLIEDIPGRGRDSCTYCIATRFYSYRRDKDASGRLVGVIVAK